jgi:hypothetical protein
MESSPFEVGNQRLSRRFDQTVAFAIDLCATVNCNQSQTSTINVD